MSPGLGEMATTTEQAGVSPEEEQRKRLRQQLAMSMMAANQGQGQGQGAMGGIQQIVQAMMMKKMGGM